VVRLVLMAAGQATRMGSDKLALPWRDSAVLGEVLERVIQGIHLLLDSAYSTETHIELMVVARQPMEFYASDFLIRTFNKMGGKWQKVGSPLPLAESIRLGIHNLSDRAIGVGFLPGDQIGVKSFELVALMRHFLEAEPDLLVPFAGSIAGSPVFFHRQYLNELQNLHGEQGGKTILYRYPARWTKHLVDMSFFDDLDTPEEYKRLLDKDKAGD